MKAASLIIALLIVSISSAQDIEVVNNAISLANEAQDPNLSLKELREISMLLPKVTDSLQAKYHLAAGIAFGQLGNMDSSFFHLDKCEFFARKAENVFLELKSWNTRGLVYMGMGKYDESLSAYQTALKLSNKNETPKFLQAIRKIYGNTGGIYFQLQEFSKAIDVTRRALAISEKLDDNSGRAYNHLRLALVYNDLDSLDQGIHHLLTASNFFKHLNDTTTLLYAENTLGRIFEKKSQFDSAMKHYFAAQKLAKSIGSQEEVAFTTISVSSIHLALGELREAKTTANKALIFSQENNFTNSEKRAHNLLYQIALEENQLRIALNHRNRFYELDDSLNGVEMKSRIAELETKYETAQKQAEIERLALENELIEANLSSARNGQYAMGIGGSLFIALVIVYFTQRHRKQQAEKVAQEMQLEAVKKRFMELHTSPAELAIQLDYEELNHKLNNPLTQREFDVLKLSLEGRSNVEIAENAYISVNTVKYHIRNIYSKIGVSNRKEAFQFILKKS